MKRHSSIFSFETLERPRSAPKGALFAVSLLLLFEFATRLLVANEMLVQVLPLADWVASKRDTILREHPDVWLLGNSTLDYGVDTDILEKASGFTVVKLSHGSATVRGSVAMLEYYLSRVDRIPKAVVLLATKDDLNRNGSRADASDRYLEYDTLLGNIQRINLGRISMIRRTHGSLRERFIELLDAGYEYFRQGGVSRGPRRTSSPTFHGRTIDRDHPVLEAASRDFGPDFGAIGAFAALCDRFGIRSRLVVMVPVTDRYVQYHDSNHAMTHDSVLAGVADACREHGVGFVDDSRASNEYGSFRDPYHMNQRGNEEFSRTLARILVDDFGRRR